jgi:hypothetical protein
VDVELGGWAKASENWRVGLAADKVVGVLGEGSLYEAPEYTEDVVYIRIFMMV